MQQRQRANEQDDNEFKRNLLIHNAMIMLSKKELIIILLASALAIAGTLQTLDLTKPVSAANMIEIEEFRWTTFPLRVLVSTGQWGTLDYATVMHQALDDWIASIWNYTQSYNNTSLNVMDFTFYMQGVNTTTNPDVTVFFNRDEIPPYSGVVGLTVYDFDPHSLSEPVRPITINITTYSATASSLFVKDIFMHEFGHALGVGHASSAYTSNGPELMYESSSNRQAIYPSTLDIYALTLLYGNGISSQTVQLPASIPYVMLIGGTAPSPLSRIWDNFKQYILLLAIVLIVVTASVVISAKGRRTYPEAPREPMPPPPPPPPKDL